MWKVAALAVIAALPCVADAEDEVKDEATRLRERVEALEAALFPRGLDPKLFTEDAASMRNLAGLLIFSQFPMRDGALDVYRVAAEDVPADRQLELLRSSRTGIGPSAEELKQRDYTHFPYERFRGDAVPQGDGTVPLFWDRVAQIDGTRLVALASGAAKRMKESDVLALLDKHGQRTICYSKDAISFTYPRRFRVIESQRGPVRIILVEDAVTRWPDIFLMLHGKQTPQYFAEFYAGLKAGLKVETVAAETQAKEKIADEEVTGTKLVYESRNDPTKYVLRFFTIHESCTISVQTTQTSDAFVYRRLSSILRSVAIAKGGSD